MIAKPETKKVQIKFTDEGELAIIRHILWLLIVLHN